MAQDWARSLLEARQQVGLSRAELARRASLSVETVRAYEVGRRRPSAGSLTAVLDALKLDRGERNHILVAAGFAPDGLMLRPQPPRIYFTLEEAVREMERFRWPCFITSEYAEVLAANKTAQKLWGVDLAREFTSPFERNLLSVATNPRFAGRLVNWEEAVGHLVAGWRRHHRGPEDYEDPGPYFAKVLNHFLTGDPHNVKRFLALWEDAPSEEAKVRWAYPIVWNEPGIGRMNFQGLATPANEWDGLTFNDWIPLDADSWERLERLLRKNQEPRNPQPGARF